MITFRPKGDDPYGLGGNSLPGRQRPRHSAGFCGGGYGEPGVVALGAVVGAVYMAIGGEDVAVALFGVVHFGRGGLKIARLFVDAPKRNLCARATQRRSQLRAMQSPTEIIETDAMMYDGKGNLVSQLSLLLPSDAQHAVVKGKRYTVERYEKSEDGDRVFLNPCGGSTVEVMRSAVVPTKAEVIRSMVAPTKAAPKKRSAAKKRIPKKDKDRLWQLNMLLNVEDAPGPEPTPKNNLLRELFAEREELFRMLADW